MMLQLARTLVFALIACAGGWSAVAAEELLVPHVEVRGSGEAHAVPDSAVFVAGVHVQHASAVAALDQSHAIVRAMLEVVDQVGVAREDVQTQRFDVQPQFEARRGPEPPSLVGYRVQNSLSVRLREVAKLGALLNRLLRAGANQVSQVRFEVADPEAAVRQARELAVRDAQARAEQLASLAGARVGKVLTLEELSASSPLAYGGTGLAAARAAVPVAEGSAAFTVTVRARFTLEW